MKSKLNERFIQIAYGVYYHSPQCYSCLGNNIRRSNRIIRVTKLREKGGDLGSFRQYRGEF